MDCHDNTGVTECVSCSSCGPINEVSLPLEPETCALVDAVTWGQICEPNAAMEVLKPPGPVNFKASNAADAWDKWAARFSNYFKASEPKKKRR